jgi:hypothetical protein
VHKSWAFLVFFLVFCIFPSASPKAQIVCFAGNSQVIATLLENTYKTAPQWEGVSGLVRFILYLEKTQEKWLFVAFLPADRVCILASGDTWEQVEKGDPT